MLRARLHLGLCWVHARSGEAEAARDAAAAARNTLASLASLSAPADGSALAVSSPLAGLSRLDGYLDGDESAGAMGGAEGAPAATVRDATLAVQVVGFLCWFLLFCCFWCNKWIAPSYDTTMVHERM